MFLNLAPLRKHRDYRLLYTGQLVSMFGSMITYVAVPYQVYRLTGSSLVVGLLVLVAPSPPGLVLMAALYAVLGAFALRLLLAAEPAASCGCFGADARPSLHRSSRDGLCWQ